jgi:hypothetical protein
MSHTPRFLNGTVFKRYLNAVRTTVIPLEPVVLFQIACDGAGEVFVDDSPAHLPVSVVGTAVATLTTIDQNSDVTLFGLPTMHAERIAGSAPRRYIEVSANEEIAPESNLCLEWWGYPITGSANSECPALARIRLDNQSVLMGMKHAATPTMRFYAGVEGVNNSGSQPYLFDQWNYCAIQYVAADKKAYCSVNNVLVNTMTFVNGLTATLSTSFVGLLLSSGTTGNFNRIWESRLAQIRCTRGNLYGSSAAPIPAGPWPKFP